MNTSDPRHCSCVHATHNIPTAVAAPRMGPKAALDTVGTVLTCIVQSEDYNSLHDAANFSRLLCVNQQLRQVLLRAAMGRVCVSWPSSCCQPAHLCSMVLWLQQHLQLGTLKRVEVCQNILAVPLVDYAGLLTAATVMSQHIAAFVHRLASSLACAAAYLAPEGQLPRVDGWCSAGLLPASLSQLPGQHLTKLILNDSYDELDAATLQELAALTALQELRLPKLAPTPPSLVPVLSSLTNLTALLRWFSQRRASWSASHPAHKSVLVLSRGSWTGVDLDLRHLTALHALHLQDGTPVDTSPAEYQDFNVAADVDAAFVRADMLLPCSLRMLSAVGIRSVYPLKTLTQLKSLQLCGLERDYEPYAPKELSKLDHIASVSFVQRAGRTASLQAVNAFVSRYKGLRYVVPHLAVDVPTTATDAAQTWFNSLGSLTSLTRLQLSKAKARRAAAILTAAAAAGGNAVGAGAFNGTVQQLAAAVSRLTSLSVLGLRALPLVTAGGFGAVGHDWDPLTAAIAQLPQLNELQCEAMPLGLSVVALSAAAHLSSLQLINCQVDESALVSMVQDMRCSSCLQVLPVSAPVLSGTPPLCEAALAAISQHLPQLRQLELPGRESSATGRVVVTVLEALEEPARFGGQARGSRWG